MQVDSCLSPTVQLTYCKVTVASLHCLRINQECGRHEKDVCNIRKGYGKYIGGEGGLKGKMGLRGYGKLRARLIHPRPHNFPSDLRSIPAQENKYPPPTSQSALSNHNLIAPKASHFKEKIPAVHHCGNVSNSY